MCSPEGLPLAPMWIGTQADSNALNTLRSIKNSHKVLLELNGKLNEILSTHDKFKKGVSEMNGLVYASTGPTNMIP
jgi:hypothetical protein